MTVSSVSWSVLVRLQPMASSRTERAVLRGLSPCRLSIMSLIMRLTSYRRVVRVPGATKSFDVLAELGVRLMLYLRFHPSASRELLRFPQAVC